MKSIYPSTLKGIINFAADRNDGGQFSNTRPERSRQNLRAVEVEIRNGRAWQRKPELAVEGLTLATHSGGAADWSNKDWIQSEYVPSCLKLVQQLTGAARVMPIYVPLQRRVDFQNYKGAAPTAGFVHLDQTRDTARVFSEQMSKSAGISLKRAAIYNVWKCMTPPPQDYPLTVCDQQSVSEEILVPGETVEYLGDKEEKLVSPYLTLVPSDELNFYYFPSMTPDESIVFVGASLDPTKPLGCPHSAFRHPDPLGATVPRASIETRVLAVFE